jgi:hypothetical protein
MDAQSSQSSKEMRGEKQSKMHQSVHMHNIDRKKAHLPALGVHRGGGASIEYLQGNDKSGTAQTGEE